MRHMRTLGPFAKPSVVYPPLGNMSQRTGAPRSSRVRPRHSPGSVLGSTRASASTGVLTKAKVLWARTICPSTSRTKSSPARRWSESGGAVPPARGRKEPIGSWGRMPSWVRYSRTTGLPQPAFTSSTRRSERPASPRLQDLEGPHTPPGHCMGQRTAPQKPSM